MVNVHWKGIEALIYHFFFKSMQTGAVKARSVFFQILTKGTPYFVYFLVPNFDLYSASVNAMIYAIQHYTGQLNNRTRLYISVSWRFSSPKRWNTILLQFSAIQHHHLAYIIMIVTDAFVPSWLHLISNCHVYLPYFAICIMLQLLKRLQSERSHVRFSVVGVFVF